MAGRNTSITLSDHFIDYAARQVASGRYASTSEVVREGLRLHEERERKREALIQALIEGEESGSAEDFDFDAFIAEIGEDDEREAA